VLIAGPIVARFTEVIFVSAMAALLAGVDLASRSGEKDDEPHPDTEPCVP
jgi:hypothetical protein